MDHNKVMLSSIKTILAAIGMMLTFNISVGILGGDQGSQVTFWCSLIVAIAAIRYIG